jgi:cytochrome c oxidase subunit 2
MRRAALLACCAVLMLCGCDRNQDVLNPAGDHAQLIHTLWWLFVIPLSVVYGLVLLFTGVAIGRSARKHGTSESPPPVIKTDPKREQRITRTVTTLVVLTIIALLALMLKDFLTDRSLHALADPNALKIKIVGHQWWWEVEYENPTPSNIFKTANEIHIPVGQTVLLSLESHDVIHSFWAPNLSGKKDLIPGHPTTAYLRAEKIGTYRGQCAEYCGYQHANMRFLVVVESQKDFEQWLQSQRSPARTPEEPSELHGRDVFMGSTCIMCHSITGTDAHASFGPNLTHIGSRQFIAGDSIPNTRGYLGGWILDSQHIKPGAHMPMHNLKPDELRALIDYLESLK